VQEDEEDEEENEETDENINTSLLSKIWNFMY
jgi:hypothetical protein